MADEARTLLAEAGRVLKAEGAFTRNRWGEARPHPALALERDSRVGLCRALRELGLELQDADSSRPPRIGGGRS